MTGPGGRVRRRAFLRGGLATGAATLATGALPGCGPSVPSGPGAAPAVRPAVLQVPLQLYVVGEPHGPTGQRLIQDFLDSSFNARHKGVRAMAGFQGPAEATVAAITSGSAMPAVVSGCCVTWPTLLPFLARLDPYFQQDNVPLSTWGRGQLARFRQPDGLYGLPEDAACDVYLYRQDILDQLGLQYPAPDWTAAEATRLWRTCSGQTSAGWRYEANAPFGPGTTEGLPTVVAGFGGAFMDAGQTRCLLNAAGSIRAGEYWLHQVWDKVLTNGDGSPNPLIASGQLVFNTSADPTVLYAVQQLGSSIKWDFIPWPRMPVRPVGKLHDNFYALVAQYPHQEVAWELLKFIAIEPTWSRYYMRLALAPPMLAGMMQEWYTILRSVAPILKDKHLEYWGQPTLEGWGIYDYEFFRYAPVNALGALVGAWGGLWDHKTTVTLGFREIARQIDGIEAAGASAAPPATAAQLIGAQHRLEAGVAQMISSGS